MADTDSRRTQAVVTFVLGGLGTAAVWPHLEPVARGLIVVFAVLAACSIHNGTWMQNHRELRQQDRERRKQAYREAKRFITGR